MNLFCQNRGIFVTGQMTMVFISGLLPLITPNQIEFWNEDRYFATTCIHLFCKKKRERRICDRANDNGFYL